MAAPDLLARDLRASPLYELVLYDRLPAAQREALAELARDPQLYGVLRPRGGGGGVKSVDRDTALLFLTLREPGPLPAYVRGALGAAAGRTIARLVADGVLEVAHGNGFVSGPAALPLLAAAGAARDGDDDTRDGRLAALSRAALRYAESLPIDEPSLLAWRLYAFNRLPLTPRWRRLLPDAAAVERHLGIAPGGPHRRQLDRAWTPTASTGWLSWTARRSGRGGRSAAPAGGPTWKLYVSPLPAALVVGNGGDDGFGAVLAAITASGAAQFKIGRDAAGLLRPDKIVAYFPSFERLAAAAEGVLRHLGGAPAQGVPFTSEIGGGGLLSWGVDPPESEGLPGAAPESWRLWLAHRLARALLAARAPAAAGVAVAEIEPWRFALERLRLEGVDTATWTPGAALWKEA